MILSNGISGSVDGFPEKIVGVAETNGNNFITSPPLSPTVLIYKFCESVIYLFVCFFLMATRWQFAELKCLTVSCNFLFLLLGLLYRFM